MGRRIVKKIIMLYLFEKVNATRPLLRSCTKRRMHAFYHSDDRQCKYPLSEPRLPVPPHASDAISTSVRELESTS